MEADTDHFDFIQNYANMESRDRKEAMELGNRNACEQIMERMEPIASKHNFNSFAEVLLYF